MLQVTRRPYLFSFTLLITTFLLSIAVGSVFIPPITLAMMPLAWLPGISISPEWPETFTTIVYQIRLPHTVLMTLTGAALAGSGAAYQGIFRNPLADPYLIGVASGAGLGAVIALALQWPSDFLGLFTVPAFAFLGAIITVAIVYNLARVGKTVPTTTLILAGVAFSSFATALTSFLMIRSDTELRRAISWLLGGGALSGWPPILAMLPYVVIGLAALLLSGHALNVLQFGEEQAQQLGLPIERIKLLIILAASLTAAAAVAFAGIIGFIGLIVPHVVRMTWGPDYRRLIPLSIIIGGCALLVADLIARVALAPQTLPVGIVTALAGAPFFLWILRKAKAQAYW
ncbi:MAG: iron chelate uptake ABC transporter family permease subunit [Anaerolineales bacterium]|jgi:iron complex transport system permease protein